jgi:hypothetical protein
MLIVELRKLGLPDKYPILQGNDPSCLREFLVPILSQNSPSGNIGLQVWICIYGNVIAAYYFLKLSDVMAVFCCYSIDAR